MFIKKQLRYAFLSLLGLALVGCSTTSAITVASAMANAALEASGLKKPAAPEVSDALKAPRTVSIKLHASNTLNVDTAGRPLALVAKIYKLRQNTAFVQATYDTFLNPQKEKEALGTDLLEVKEVTLVPGQRYEVLEKVSHEARYIGVVGLFRNPAPARWRVDFLAASAEGSGITVGMHACALTIGAGTSSTDTASNSQLLASVRCP
jgi:type VI secretion system protein VasD